jgi:peptide/nickel transport system substrate-binding protein
MQRVRKVVFGMALLLVMAALVSACGGGGTTSGGGDSSEPSANVKPGGTLNVSDGEENTSLNPQKVFALGDVNVVSQINEPLYKEGFNGKIGPWLVEKATHTPDYKSWTMKLKPGIEFSTGKPMTSADVAFTLNLGKESEIYGSLFANVTSIKAPDKSTVVITSSVPFPELPLVLSQWSWGIMPKDFGGESEAEFGQHPIGTGPFEFSSWKKGQGVTLVKNPHYWIKGEPKVDTVAYHTVEDPNSRAAQVTGGSLDLAFSPPTDQVEALESSPDTNIAQSGLAFGWMMVLNTTKQPFEFLKAREAIDLATDRDGILKIAGSGQGEPGAALLEPTTYTYDPNIKPPERDLKKAKELFAEAVKEGMSPEFTITVPAELPFLITASQILQQNFEEVGFKTDIKKVTDTTGFGLATEGETQMFLSGNNQPANTSVELFTFYNNEHALWTQLPTQEMETLLTAAQQETDPKKREHDYWHMQEIVAKDKAILTMAYTPYTWAYGSNVGGVKIGNSGVAWLAKAGFVE